MVDAGSCCFLPEILLKSASVVTIVRTPSICAIERPVRSLFPSSDYVIVSNWKIIFSLISLIYLTILLHLASSHNASNQLLSHLFSKKRCLDHNDLNNYWPVSNLRFIAK